MKARDVHGLSVLYYAVNCGNAGLVEQLLRSGSPLDDRGPGQCTPLMAAATCGATAIVRILAEARASLTARDDDGRDALLLAVQRSHFATVYMLTALGATWEPDALEEALVEGGWHRLEAYRALELGSAHHLLGILEDEGDSNTSVDVCAEADGITALHMCAQHGYVHAGAMLLRQGADPSKRDTLGMDALYYATLGGQLAMVETLLEASCDVSSSRDIDGATPLHEAARQGSLELIGALWAASCDLDATDVDGRTALHLAALHGRVKCVSVLIGLGSPAALRDNGGDTVFTLGARYDLRVQGRAKGGAVKNTAKEACVMVNMVDNGLTPRPKAREMDLEREPVLWGIGSARLRRDMEVRAASAAQRQEKARLGAQTRARRRRWRLALVSAAAASRRGGVFGSLERLRIGDASSERSFGPEELFRRAELGWDGEHGDPMRGERLRLWRRHSSEDDDAAGGATAGELN